MNEGFIGERSKRALTNESQPKRNKCAIEKNYLLTLESSSE